MDAEDRDFVHGDDILAAIAAAKKVADEMGVDFDKIPYKVGSPRFENGLLTLRPGKRLVLVIEDELMPITPLFMAARVLQMEWSRLTVERGLRARPTLMGSLAKVLLAELGLPCMPPVAVHRLTKRYAWFDAGPLYPTADQGIVTLYGMLTAVHRYIDVDSGYPLMVIGGTAYDVMARSPAANRPSAESDGDFLYYLELCSRPFGGHVY